MSEEKGKPEPAEAPFYEMRDGRVYIEGHDVTAAFNQGREPEPEDKPPEAALEGEEAEPQEEPKEEPEPEKDEEEPPVEEKPEEPEEEEEEPEPDKLKFKLKFRGKEEEVEYDPAQIQVRLNKLRAFEENEREFWDKRKRIEPYAEVVESEWFKEKLKEAYETGELQRPQKPQEVPATVQYEIMKRQAEPDYPRVMQALQAYALSLPDEAQQLIDSNAEVFLSEYDRFAKMAREEAPIEKKETKPEPKKVPKLSPEETKVKLALKEKAKENAAVTPPGVAKEAVHPRKAWEARKRQLEKDLRNPASVNRSLEVAAELLMHMENEPQ